MITTDEQVKSFQCKIIGWYEKYGRVFPWRTTRDPYKVMISEILLQKTHVRKVPEIFIKFIDQFPSITELSEAKIQNVIEIIRPLGFLNRADRLIEIAKCIKLNYQGIIPNDFKILKSFKGIGNYIATAILIFAYEKKMVVVDTNVIKVLRKELDFISKHKRPRNDKILWDFANTLAPEDKIKEFNWGLLDYGATLK